MAADRACQGLHGIERWVKASIFDRVEDVLLHPYSCADVLRRESFGDPGLPEVPTERPAAAGGLFRDLCGVMLVDEWVFELRSHRGSHYDRPARP